MFSPYDGLNIEDWKSKTKELISEHPLNLEEIREFSVQSWDSLWETYVGSGCSRVSLTDMNPPAQIVGHFFEKILARKLSKEYPDQWRGEISGGEKDLVYTENGRYSMEVKSSGQLGDKVFGNRSYGQGADSSTKKGDKSGYYLTVNFRDTTLTVLRFGWIDFEDWEAQSAASGQAATLNDSVYEHKLLDIYGEYRLNAPVEILDGIGPARTQELEKIGVYTVGDLVSYTGDESTPVRFKAKALDFAGMDHEDPEPDLFS